MRIAFLITALTGPSLALADEPLSGAAFEALVTGRTLTFASETGAYGIERYETGRRVLWSFLDGTCEAGRWYEADGAICFVYDFEPDPQCWLMFDQGAAGLRAEFQSETGSTVIHEATERDEPLVCGNFGS